MVDQNARLGRLPGDPNSTDPDSTIQQPYTSQEASGGFLWANIESGDDKALLKIKMFDEYGKTLYEATKEQDLTSIK